MASARPDYQLYAEIVDTLSSAPQLGPGEIRASIDAGVVVLSGDVADRRTKLEAAHLVRAVAGVREIRNILSVDEGRNGFQLPHAGA